MLLWAALEGGSRGGVGCSKQGQWGSWQPWEAGAMCELASLGGGGHGCELQALGGGGNG